MDNGRSDTETAVNPSTMPPMHGSSQNDYRISITNMTEEDIPAVATLVSINFDGPFAWWQGLQKTYSYYDNKASLEQRFFTKKKAGRLPHTMLAAKIGGDVVAFVELGLLNIPWTANTEDIDKKLQEFKGILTSTGKDGKIEYWLPVIGNLVVSEDHRRKGIAQSLIVAVANECCNVWNVNASNMYCYVESENRNAIDLYLKKMAFEEANDKLIRNMLTSAVRTRTCILLKKSIR
jgi:ribosomal protein S18 acetylase RimI-like enzyme